MSLQVNLHLHMHREKFETRSGTSGNTLGRGWLEINLSGITLYLDRAAIAQLQEALEELGNQIRDAEDGPSDAETEGYATQAANAAHAARAVEP